MVFKPETNNELYKAVNLWCSNKKTIFKPETNDELYKAVNLWCNNKKKALEKYGEINTWNTINITSINGLFISGIHLMLLIWAGCLMDVKNSINH